MFYRNFGLSSSLYLFCFAFSIEKGKNSGPFGNFDNYDRNEDEVITVDEIISIAHERKIITMLESDVKEM